MTTPNSWYDPSKVAPGADLNSILQSLSGVKLATPGSQSRQQTSGETDGQAAQFQDSWTPDVYTGPNGEKLTNDIGIWNDRLPIGLGTDPGSSADSWKAYQSAMAQKAGLDPSQTYLSGWYDNPLTNEDGNSARVLYKLDPSTGQAVPVGANNYKNQSQWTGFLRPLIENGAATVAAGYGAALGGAALAGTSLGATGAGEGALMSGMDLAADGGVNATAGGWAGTGAGAGGSGSVLGDYGEGLTGPGGPGTTLSTQPSTLSSIGNYLGGVSPSTYLNLAKAALPLVGAIAGRGAGGGGTATTPGTGGQLGTASAPTTGYLADGAGRYTPQDFHATMPAARPGHTRGPSSAVNLNDPSAAMFGYGDIPKYFQSPAAATSGPSMTIQPPTGPKMADGGTVDDDYGNPLQLDGPAQTAAQPDMSAMYGPSNLPTQDEGPMAWISRLLGDGKSWLGKKGNTQLAMGGLGLLASLLQSRQPAGYRSASQLRADVSSGQNAQLGPAASAYFAAPPHTYVPPHSPFKPASYMADGGAVMPDATARSAYQAEHMAQGGMVGNQSHFVSMGGGQDDKVPAQLSPGEYVHPADVVSALGDGNNAEGAKRLRAMEVAVRTHKRSGPTNKIPPMAKSPLEYMKGAM